MSLSENITKLRKQKGLSTERLSALAEVTKSTVNYMETGRTKSPQVDNLKRIADVLGVTVDELIK